MSFINLRHVSVDFPVFNAASRSLKNQVLSVATGGAINRRNDGVVTVKGLENVSLDLRDGERIGLVGHNGSGKTTLLRVLAGIYVPSTGTIDSEGERVSLIDISLGIDPEATGRENIKLRAAIMGMTRRDLDEMMPEIKLFSGLGDFLDMPFRTYSSGMQLRLAFSISTCVRPDILIMDEWLSTGDEDFREKANERMREIVETSRILVLASHSRELLQDNCTRIIWMEHGRVRMDGATEEVLGAYFHHP